MYYVGGHLKCKNVVRGGRRACWNHVQVPAALTRRLIVTWLAEQLAIDAGLHRAILEIVRQHLQTRNGRRGQKRDFVREIASLERQAANLAHAIAEGGQMQALVQKLRSIHDHLEAVRKAQQAAIPAQKDAGLSEQDLVNHLPEAVLDLVDRSFEFAALMRRLFPEFLIKPVQALDSGQIRPRGKLVFRPATILTPDGDKSSDQMREDVPVTIDLFDPPVHISAVGRCLAAKEADPKLSLKKIATNLGLNHMAVKRAFDYAHRMQCLGTNDPYVEVRELPPNASRWRRRS